MLKKYALVEKQAFEARQQNVMVTQPQFVMVQQPTMQMAPQQMGYPQGQLNN